MLDIDTFLTALYVMVDDSGKCVRTAQARPGPPPSLSRSEVITLALFSQWAGFGSERGFYRWAQCHLRGAFPTLPHRSQFNRLLRHHREAIATFALHLVTQLHGRPWAYERLDTTAVPTRDAKRRGRGWLSGQADLGWSNRLGWYEGFVLMLSITPTGAISGFGFGAASTSDLALAETFLAARRPGHAALPTVGQPAPGPYVADRGFVGEAAHQRWQQLYGAEVINPPRRNQRRSWPKALRRWLASLRQLIETVNGKLHLTFRLEHERPHALTGFQARLAAKIGLHNFCLWLNQHVGRPPLAFVDLIQW